MFLFYMQSSLIVRGNRLAAILDRPSGRWPLQSPAKVKTAVTRMIVMAAQVYLPDWASKCSNPHVRATPNSPELIFPCEASISESRSTSASKRTPCWTRATRPSGVQT